MAYRPGDSYYTTFVTSIASGAATTADSLPTAAMYHNAAVDVAVTLTVALISAGLYSISGTIPGTYSANDSVEVVVSATITAIAAKGTVDSFSLGSTAAALTAADVWGYVGSRTLSAFGFTVNTNANSTETAIAAKTTNLPADPASQTTSNAIKLKTDNLPADPTSATTVGSPLQASGYTVPPTATSIATAVWGATTKLLSGFGFTVATNSDANVTAIKAKTDGLPADPTSAATVGSPLQASGYTAPPTAAAVAAAVWSYVARTITSFGFTVSATPDPDVALIKAKTNALPADPASDTNVNLRMLASSYTAPSTAAAIAAAVWGYVARTLTNFGFTVEANNLPADYQRNNVAVVLPSSAPAWYHDPDNSAVIAAVAAVQTTAGNTYAAAAGAANSSATAVTGIAALIGRSDTSANVASIMAVANKLNTMLEIDGADWRLTVESLSNAPAGEGGGSGGATVNQIIDAMNEEGFAKIDDVRTDVTVTGG